MPKSRFSLHPLGFQGGNAAGKHRFGNQRERRAQIQGIDTGPFPGAFLAGAVEDFFYQRRAVCVICAQNIGSDLNQIAVEFGLVPLGKGGPHFGMVHTQAVFHKLVGFADKLHIAVFDAVVHHFHKMAGTIFTHPVATYLATGRFGGYCLQNRLYCRPSFRIAAGHDRRPMARAFFTTGNTGADK